jgi:acyl-CoA reductase-like NAD-dependent aldehyde dehydrogenase
MRYKMLTNGKLVKGATTTEVEDPATFEIFEQCPRTDEAQLVLAVAAAKSALSAWTKRSYTERGASLVSLADALQKNADAMARLLTHEQGKRLGQAQFEVGSAIAFLKFTATQSLPNKTLRDSDSEYVIETRSPPGVVAAIAPWNYPVLLMIMKIAPALLTGNTVVAKPAPITPLTTLFFGEIAGSILPAGVLNVVADNNDFGATLSIHPDIAKVSLTGSTRTGIHVLQSASSTLNRVTLELGGNDAVIILDDVDIDEVAPKIFNAAMLNSGQGKSEALFQEPVGHPISHVDIPDSQTTTAIYAGAEVRGTSHEQAARKWLTFIRSPAAFQIFEQYGFGKYEPGKEN